jgi:hypothetical protein
MSGDNCSLNHGGDIGVRIAIVTEIRLYRDGLSRVLSELDDVAEVVPFETVLHCVAEGKALFYRQIEVGIKAAYEDAGATMACNMMDPCALEGVQAFIDKRPPSWSAPPSAT